MSHGYVSKLYDGMPPVRHTVGEEVSDLKALNRDHPNLTSTWWATSSTCIPFQRVNPRFHLRCPIRSDDKVRVSVDGLAQFSGE